MFNEFFFQIEDYLVYCRTQCLLIKTIKEKIVVEYLSYVKNRGKYTVVTDEYTKNG